MRTLCLTILAIVGVLAAYRLVPSILITTGLEVHLFIWLSMLTGAALGGLLIWLGIISKKKVDAG